MPSCVTAVEPWHTAASLQPHLLAEVVLTAFRKAVHQNFGSSEAGGLFDFLPEVVIDKQHCKTSWALFGNIKPDCI